MSSSNECPDSVLTLHWTFFTFARTVRKQFDLCNTDGDDDVIFVLDTYRKFS